MKTLFSVGCLLCAWAGCVPDDAQQSGARPLTSNVVDWRDEVVYQLLVDRFGDGDTSNDAAVNPSGLARYQGGDWQGVIDHIDYLQALGVTAVWVSPVVRNVDTDANVDGYHGYWAQDLGHVNPHFGTLEDLRRMVDALHAHHIKVILDIVTNHLGQLFFYDINENGVPDEVLYGSGSQSMLTRVTEYDPDFDPRGIQAMTSLGESGLAPIRWIEIPEIHRMPPLPPEFQNPDWYNRKGRVTHFDPAPGCDDACAREQTLTGDFPGGLKDLKTLSPDVQDAMVRAYTYWIGAADFDAFRIDTLKHVEHEFWNRFCPGVRDYCKQNGKRNFFMFGEAFDGRDDLVSSYTTDEQVDSAFNFPQKFVLDRVFKQGQDTQQLADLWTTQVGHYATAAKTDGAVDAQNRGLLPIDLLVNFLDNHDVARFAFDKPCTAAGQCAALWNALALVFTARGVPCIYYGTEQEFAGGNDPSNRERLWDSGYATDGATFQYIRTLSDLRRKYRPLRHGDALIEWATMRNGAEPDAGVFAFERVDADDGKRVLVVLNTSEAHASSPVYNGSPMKTGFPAGTVLTSVHGGDDTVTVDAGGTVTISVPPQSHRVYVAQEDVSGIAPLGN
jgi:glycosidase